jgi:hypothetical protein
MHIARARLRSIAARVCCYIAVLLAALTANAAATELKIIATDPAPDALLARQQPFYVRFELQHATPATVTISGLYKGNAVFDDGGTGAPAILPANGGTGVVSFFYWGEKPTRIDEVRLKVGDPQSGATIAEYNFPVKLTWLMDDPPARVPPAWVTESKRIQAAGGTGNAGFLTGPALWIAVATIVTLLAIAIAWSRRRRAQPPHTDTDKHE